MIGVIGGSGLYKIDGVKTLEEIPMETPFGSPSGPIAQLEYQGQQFFFIARHGEGHRLNPSEINYRANIFALKKLGVKKIISVSAVGSLVEECPPGKIVLPDQFIDWTKGKRPRTFFEKGVVGHVSCADPICLELKNKVSDICQNLGIDYQNGGNYICIEGPQFSTRFESRFYKSMGATIIGMTNIPEGYLAKEAGISYATVALVTDYDAWKEHHCTTDEIIKTMNKNIAKAQKIVLGIVSSEAITKLEVEPQNKNCLISNTSHLSPQMTSNLATLLE